MTFKGQKDLGMHMIYNTSYYLPKKAEYFDHFKRRAIMSKFVHFALGALFSGQYFNKVYRITPKDLDDSEIKSIDRFLPVSLRGFRSQLTCRKVKSPLI